MKPFRHVAGAHSVAPSVLALSGYRGEWVVRLPRTSCASIHVRGAVDDLDKDRDLTVLLESSWRRPKFARKANASYKCLCPLRLDMLNL